jgi:hypothetical protein
MALSVFENKAIQPANEELGEVLGTTAVVWNELKKYALGKSDNYYEEWAYSGKNYGWGFRVREKKRAIIYLTPQKGFFLFSAVFGEKATIDIMESNISKEIKGILSEAKVYAEGRGFRIEVRDDMKTDDLKKLIDFKVKY